MKLKSSLIALLTLITVAVSVCGCKKDKIPAAQRVPGTYLALTGCKGASYQMVIEPSTLGGNYVNVKNIDGDSVSVFGTVQEDKAVVIQIPEQIVGNTTYTGNVVLNEDLLTGMITVWYSGNFCQGAVTRQN